MFPPLSSVKSANDSAPGLLRLLKASVTPGSQGRHQTTKLLLSVCSCQSRRMSLSLTQRLQALADSYKQTVTLIQELQKFPAGTSTSGDADERRVELANEIHDSLKEQEDRLEILRQEVEDDSLPLLHRRGHASFWLEERERERERNADLMARLAEDIKNARASFRHAQLQAKRNVDAAKRKEREQLFADRKIDHAPSRRPGQERLTQDELALQASEDVTRALRRVHNLLEGNLAQSQFAQQTLDESQEALKDLTHSYGGTSDLLKNSRGLVTQLIRSTKSDSWYLQTAWWILLVTICWLVFRRILYGPLWWLLWQPLRLLWWITLTSLGSIGFGQAKSEVNVSSSLSVISRGIPTNPPGVYFRSMALPNKGGQGWDRRSQPPQHPNDESMVEKVGRTMDEPAHHGTNLDDITEEERRIQEEQPRNSLKRMMEQEKETEIFKDEL